MGDPSSNGHGLEVENLGDAGATPGSTAPRMLVPLFLVPLLIVAVIVGVFLMLGSVLGREKTVAQWIDEFETGGVNERWQAAAHLTELARTEPAALDDPGIREKLRHLFVAAGPSEPRIRQYLAQLWTAIEDPEAAPLILEGIRRTRERLSGPEQAKGDEREQAGRELIYYVRALGTVGGGEAESTLVELTDDPDSGVRVAVAEALGVAGRRAIRTGSAPPGPVVDALVRLYADGDAWVRMNAALGLGKLGRTEGLATLEAMLDREWLRSQNLRFPDDGKYSVTQHDPAAVPILSALVTIGSLVEGSLQGGPAVDRAALLAAVERVTEDPNPELQRRARELLDRLRG